MLHVMGEERGIWIMENGFLCFFISNLATGNDLKKKKSIFVRNHEEARRNREKVKREERYEIVEIVREI